jgi:hypothetical protein
MVDWTMQSAPFSASGKSFSIHEWRGSGPATLHVHRSDDEAWHVLEGELTFRYADRVEIVGPGTTVFVPAGVAHTYNAGVSARHLIILTPRLSALIGAASGRSRPSPSNERSIDGLISTCWNRFVQDHAQRRRVYRRLRVDRRLHGSDPL